LSHTNQSINRISDIVTELDEVTEGYNEAMTAHEDFRRRSLEKFMEDFGRITLKLIKMYQMITLGGDAELELVDSLDPFSEGMVFSIHPPKRSWKNVSNQSGRKQTLSSLALVCIASLQTYAIICYGRN
jgi:structural maintenance of chromosome 4